MRRDEIYNKIWQLDRLIDKPNPTEQFTKQELLEHLIDTLNIIEDLLDDNI